jgi:hypothetical protein
MPHPATMSPLNSPATGATILTNFIAYQSKGAVPAAAWLPVLIARAYHSAPRADAVQIPLENTRGSRSFAETRPIPTTTKEEDHELYA